MNDGVEPRPPGLPPDGMVENIDARNGFAPPRVPVACGRRPTPSDEDDDVDKDEPRPVACAVSPGKPVGCDERVEPEFDAGGEAPGVEGAEGIGGSDSSNAAPKDEDGLNALSPLNPVVCLCSGVVPVPADEMEMDGAPADDVAPVGCEESEEKRESEKVEPEVVLDVGCEVSGDENDEFCAPPGLEESNVNDEATLAMIDPFVPPEFEFELEFAFGLEAPLGCDPKLEPKLPKLGNAPVCMGCCCCACCGCCPEGFALLWLPKPIANSMSVGGLGTGGAGATGCPNGFLEPVWCVLTGWAGGGEADGPSPVSGAVAERGGPAEEDAVADPAGCANGCTIVVEAADVDDGMPVIELEKGNDGCPVGAGCCGCCC